MMIAWGGCAPVAILMARYWKRWPAAAWPERLDHKSWWHGHRLLNWAALILSALGFYWLSAPIVDIGATISRAFNPRSTGELIHRLSGISVLMLVLAQVIGGYLRGSKGGPTDKQIRGDHFDMTPRRRAFEWLHKTLGWCCLLMAGAALLSGLAHADAPRWMFVSLVSWWLLLLGLGIRWQAQKRCIDTYQAIWGPNPSLPGMQYKPIGFGITRIK